MHSQDFGRSVTPASGAAANAPAGDDVQRARARLDGHLVAISGGRALVAINCPDSSDPGQAIWGVGELITIYGKKSRIICLAKDLATKTREWALHGENIVQANLELLGEIVDEADGRTSFRRGISFYPSLGAPVHRIRMSDLAAIYDLGARAATPIGRLVQAEHIEASIDVKTMLHRHFAVVGSTGVGKSCSVSILVEAAVSERKQLRVIVLDPHNEYSHAFRANSHTVAASEIEIPFWIFQLDEFVEAVYRGAPVPPEEVDILREAINAARDCFVYPAEKAPSVLKRAFRGAETASITESRPYRIVDVMGHIENELGRLELRYSRSALRAVKARLEAIGNDSNYRFMFSKAALDGNLELALRNLFRLHDGDRPITILQLAGIPSDVVNAAVSVLARMAFDLAYMNAGHYEILVMCEEAHRYVPADSSLGFGPTRRALARIAKEGRKYGCCVGVVTQRPSELDPTILSQCSTIFAMRLTNAADQEIISKAIPDNSAGVMDFISSLGNREAIAFGEAVATPMRMMFKMKTDAELPRTVALAEEEDGPAEAAGQEPPVFAAPRPEPAADRAGPPAAASPYRATQAQAEAPSPYRRPGAPIEPALTRAPPPAPAAEANASPNAWIRERRGLLRK